MKFDKLKNTISRDEFLNYYTTHSRKETEKHFNIGSTVFDKLRKYYDITKSKDDVYIQRKITVKALYGCDNVFQNSAIKRKCCETKILKYGDSNYRNIEKAKNTNLSKYGVEHALSSKQIREKIKNTVKEKYGVDYITQSNVFKQKSCATKKHRYNNPFYNNRDKIKKTCMERYGAVSNLGSKDETINGRKTQREMYSLTNDYNNREKIKNTCKCKYGEDYFDKQVASMVKSVKSHEQSFVNNSFAAYLFSLGIPFEREYSIDGFMYDFKLGKYLIELDPYATHNSSWGIFNNPKTETYHRDKTLNALDKGYTCIHVFDWMDVTTILYHLINKNLSIIDTGKPVRHIYDTKLKTLTNIETGDTVIIYDDGFNVIY